MTWHGHPCDDPKQEDELKSDAPLWTDDDLAAAREHPAPPHLMRLPEWFGDPRRAWF